MDIEPGRVFSQYRLIAKVGEGGMGVVWRAVDTSLEREVAVKFLPAEVSADPERRERFAREAKLLASINHPNVATVYGLHSEAGTSFLAMELIPGRDLAHTLRERPLSIAEALGIARQIAAALEATHERGIVHRDLKPANVFVTPSGEAKVLDFGIARDIEPEQPPTSAHDDSSAAERTRQDTILGTISYMSPEQARGKPLDTRTDVWSFGCVLYELLANKPAFGGETRWDKLAAVLREEPDWNALPEGVSEAVRNLLKRCLEKGAEKRLDSAGEARKILEHELGLVTAPGWAPVTGPIPVAAARRTSVPLLVIAGAILVASAFGYWIWSTRPDTAATTALTTPDERSIAILPFESVGGGDENRAFAAGIHDDILNTVAKIGELRVISRTSVLEYLGSTKGLKQIGGELSVATVLEGTVQRAGKNVRVNVQLMDAANEASLWAASYDREFTPDGIFSIQSDIAERVATALQATLSPDEKQRLDAAPTADTQAYDAYVRGVGLLNRPGVKSEHLVAARGMFETAVERDPAFALAWTGLANAAREHYWMGGGAEEALAAACAAADRALELSPDLPEAHLAKGRVLYVQRDYPAALAELNVAEKGLPGNADLERAKAYIDRRQGRWEEGLEGLRRAHGLDPRDSLTTTEVGFTLMCMRRHDEALRYFDQALLLAPDYGAAQVYRALTPLWRDGTREALFAAAEWVESAAHDQWSYAHGWHTMLYTRDYGRTLGFLSGRARIQAQWYAYPPELLRAWTRHLQGRKIEATAGFGAAAKILEADVSTHPEDARLHGALGVAYAGLGRKEDALREGRRAIELMPIEKDAFVGTWQMQDYAWICAMTGELEEAVEALERVLAVPSVFSVQAVMLDPRADPLRELAGFKRLERFRGRH